MYIYTHLTSMFLYFIVDEPAQSIKMSSINSILTAMVMVAMLRGSDAVTCYQCSSVKPGCDDPFTATSDTCTGLGCQTSTAEHAGRYEVK